MVLGEALGLEPLLLDSLELVILVEAFFRVDSFLFLLLGGLPAQLVKFRSLGTRPPRLNQRERLGRLVALSRDARNRG